MITTHALSILVLALGLAFVLICAGHVYLQGKLNEVNARLVALEQGADSTTPGVANRSAAASPAASN